MRSWVVIAAVAVLAAGPLAAKPVGPNYVPTSLRIDMEQRDRLIGEPTALIDDGDFAGGLCAYDRLLAERTKRDGAVSYAVADTQALFGAELTGRHYNLQAIPYLQQGAKTYQALLGPDNVETAIVFNDLGETYDGLGEAYVDQADAAYAESYRMRLKLLGRDNPETALTLSHLAELRGRPEHVQGDPARLAAVLAQFAEAEGGFVASGFDRAELIDIYTAWAVTLARNGRGPEAVALFQRDGAEMSGSFYFASKLYRVLTEAGDPASARALKAFDENLPGNWDYRDYERQAPDRPWPERLQPCTPPAG